VGQGGASSARHQGAVHGNLLIGKAYTALLGLQPGDEFEIKLLGKKQISSVGLWMQVKRLTD